MSQANPDLARYQFEPEAYIQDKLGWTPWRGAAGEGGEVAIPGQADILDAYALALRQMHEKSAWEQGEILPGDLQYWQPGQAIQNYIRVEAGHTVGKTKLSSGLVNHFFDCFTPSIGYTFAPTWRQSTTCSGKKSRPIGAAGTCRAASST